MSVVGKQRPKAEPHREPPTIDGRPPPHDLDAEAAVLSACMLAYDRQATVYDEIADWLAPDQFYSEAHRQIWNAIQQCVKRGEPIDIVTVSGWLRAENVPEAENRQNRLAQVGGAGYLTEILDAAPSIANVRAYAQRVVDCYRMRRAILLCQRFTARGYAEQNTPAAYLEELEREVYALGWNLEADRAIDVKPLLVDVYGRISTAFTDGRPPGIATGFTDYDDRTVGLHRKELTLVAARPGMGKTSFMISQMVNIAGTEPMLLADDGQPWEALGCAFFSLEMPREQIGQKLIAYESRVSAHRIRTGRVNDDDWSPMTHACHRLSTMPIVIDDTSGLTLSKLRSKIRRARAKLKAKGARLTVVYLDYLQLMRGESGMRREEEIAAISRGLKEVAKDEDVAVVAGCQLNRDLEKRNGPAKRPVISDLRESGSLEQDADNIVFLFRGSVYGEPEIEGEEGRTELIIGKQRNGPTGTAIAQYIGACTRFQNMPGY